ncbi:MAG: DUF4838 domain-containing protein [Kiritimatiellia bacterium]
MNARTLGRVCALALVALAAAPLQAVDLVRNGRLNVRLEGVDVPETAFARAEFERILDAVTGCGTQPDASRAGGVIRLVVDPALGDGDTFRIVAQGEGMTIAGSNPESVGFGLFELLERLGCRWYWAGPDGEYLPEPTNCLALADFAVTSTAAIPYRDFLFHRTHSPDARYKSAFFRRQRMHPRRCHGGHLFNWVRPADCKTPEEYFARHPEQHALWQGRRVPHQHCYTHPETFRTFVDFYVREWDAAPKAEYLSLSPKDTPVHCTCEGCAAKGDASTLYFDFINRLVAALAELRPGKRYRTIAYSFYVQPPKVKLHPAITLEYCMYDRCYRHPFAAADCPFNPKALGAMAAWREVLGATPGIYGYHFDLWNAPKPMLAPMERVLQDEIRWARDHQVGYWCTEWYGGWAFAARSAGPDGSPPATIREDCRAYCHRFPAYALCRLLWNPDQSLDAIKRDWCARVYGPAADAMFAYLTAMEDAWGGGGHISAYNASPDAHADTFVTQALMTAADAAFAAAERKLAATACARAKGEVELERIWWRRWRDLKTSRSDWGEIGRHPDPDRIDYLLNGAKPTVALYPWAADPQDNWTERRYSATADPVAHRKSDWLLWGNHPRMFRGGPWVNYEFSMDFRFLPDERYRELSLHLRNRGPRFGEEFGRLAVHFTENAYFADLFLRHGTPPKPLVPRTRLAKPLGTDWHRVVVRLADTKMRVSLDGEALYTVDVPIGAGAFNVWTRAVKFDVRNVRVMRIEPPTRAEIAEYKARQAGRRAKVDGTGRVVYE